MATVISAGPSSGERQIWRRRRAKLLILATLVPLAQIKSTSLLNIHVLERQIKIKMQHLPLSFSPSWHVNTREYDVRLTSAPGVSYLLIYDIGQSVSIAFLRRLAYSKFGFHLELAVTGLFQRSVFFRSNVYMDINYLQNLQFSFVEKLHTL